MSPLRVIDGGSTPCERPSWECDELRIELVSAQGERIRHAHEQRRHLRAAIRSLAAGNVAAAGTWLTALWYGNEAEDLRARSMDAGPGRAHACADGIEGVGHGAAA